MAFRVGQKVARFRAGRANRDMPFPAIGEPVTIVNIFRHRNGKLCLEFAEYLIPAEGKFMGGMYARAFRPLVERKPDISILTALLIPNKRERADA